MNTCNKNEKKTGIRIAALLCAALTAGTSLIACGDTAGQPKTTDPAVSGDTADAVVTEAPDPFADFDLNKEQIRIYTSNDNPGGVGNSSYLIDGPDEETGDIVNDAVFKRNRDVEELLNVDLVYSRYEEDYTATAGMVDRLVMAGEDVYDIIISDLYPMASLSVKGEFLDFSDAPYLDFDQTYWYRDYMEQLSLDRKKMYLLAGDFFMDIIRSAHALYFNKDMLAKFFDSADAVYNDVLNNKWTYDRFLEYISDCYQDLNGNGTADMDDQYGFTVMQIWGPSIPFIISAGLDYVDDSMQLIMNNERSVTLLERLNDIFYSPSTCNTMNETDPNAAGLNLFKSGRCLFLGYRRLGALEDLRDMDHEVGVVPYPKLDENQKNYITSSHDTTEVGVIPVTNSKFEDTCLVLEVLNREAKKTILPAYYETALKVKYTRDELSAKMIDIIHNNIGGSFALAFSNTCSDVFMKSTFYNPLSTGSRDFASNYAKVEAGAQKKIDTLVEQFAALEN